MLQSSRIYLSLFAPTMTLPKGMRDVLRKQLTAQTALLRIIHVVNIVVALVLGVLIEPLIKTPALLKNIEVVAPCAICLIVCVLCSIILFAAERPLPQFLVEFDDLSEEFEEQKAKLMAKETNCLRVNDALSSLSYSVALYNEHNESRPENIEDFLEQIMATWVEYRDTIFDFSNSSDLWNFAIYKKETIEGEEKLVKLWRKAHDRLKQENRSWSPGQGNIGRCFLEQKTIIFPETQDPRQAQTVLDENHSANSRPWDNDQYKSFVATPIMAHDLPVGVFIITSSEICHFSRDDHLDIVESVGIVVGMIWELYTPQRRTNGRSRKRNGK